MTARKRTPKPAAPVQPRLPGPRVVLGIDPGQTGGAVALWTAPGALPQVLGAWSWAPVVRQKLPCLRVLSVTVDGPRPEWAAVSLGAVGASVRVLASVLVNSIDAVAIEAAQARPGMPGAGLAVARAAGELAGGICAAWSGRVLWPTPSAWRAVAYPGRTRAAGKPDPSGLIAQTAGWPEGSADVWPEAVPEHTAEALGVALWAAAQGEGADVRAGAKARG
jgi:hypothetical protein